MSRFHAQLSSRGGGQSYRGRNASSSSSSCHVTRHRPSSSSSSRSTRIRAIGVDTDIALSAKSVNANSALGEVKVDPRTCISIILGGGAGTRLYPLTKSRAKPAVPIGGAYRLIDVPMSNCLNSGLSKIYILTQFNSTSLNRHLSRTYNFGQGPGNGGDGFVEVLAASQTPDSKDWFGGTADAVRQYSWVLADIKNRDIDDIMILSGDHLYRMDYTEFLETHKKTDADITVGALPCDETRASSFGLMKINGSGQIVEFAEKPEGEALEKMQVDTTVLGLSPREAAKAPYIASMGIYIFKKDVLLNLLNASHAAAMDFGSEIIPKAAMDHKVQAHLFEGYWEDIGTIRSFFDANLALTEVPAKFEFYNAENPIYTAQRFLPPAKIQDCKISDSIISHGCYLESCKVEHAIVGLRSHICKGAVLKDAMVMGADYFETEEERQRILSSGDIPLGVGENSVLQNCILDKNARIGKDCIIINKEGVDELNKEEEGYIIRSGIVVICRGAKIPDGTVI